VPEVCQQQLKLPTKHVGSFLLLMFIATFRPSAIWPAFSLSLEPISILIIGLLLLYKIKLTIGFGPFFSKYKLELALIVLYQTIALFSLYLNIHRYADPAQLIRYGITFIVISASFPAVLLLFLLPQNKVGLSLSRFKYSGYLPWGYFCLLAVLAIWQSFDFESAKLLGRYFVCAEIWPANNVNGFYRISTDLGAVLAMSAIVLTSLLISNGPKIKLSRRDITLFLVLATLLIAGTLSGARVFLLMLMACGALGLLILTKGRFKLLIGLLILCFVLFNLAVFFSPYRTAVKLNAFLPYLLPMRQGEIFYLSDFSASISMDVFGERVLLWHRAIAMLSDNFLFGVSNGGFRLAGQSPIHNTHTLPLQILIDTGLVGLTVLLALLYKVGRRVMESKNTILFAIIITPVIIGLVVDFQIDHSVPWIVAVGYLIALPFMAKTQTKEHRFEHLSSQRALQLCGWANLLFIAVLTGLFLFRSVSNESLSPKQRAASFISSRADDRLMLVDSALNMSFADIRATRRGQFINMVDLPNEACLYHYADSYHLMAPGNVQTASNSRYLASNDGKLEVSKPQTFDCKSYVYPGNQAVTDKKWLTDGRLFIYRPDYSYWRLLTNTRLYSSIFELDKGGHRFEFSAQGTQRKDEWPIVIATLIDAKTGLTLSERHINISAPDRGFYELQFNLANLTQVYLKLSFSNAQLDSQSNKHRDVYLFPETFKIVEEYK
jgi:hypothetical protein